MSIRGIVKEMLINQRFLKNKKTVCIGLVLLNVLLALFGGVSLLIALNQDFD